MPGKEGRAFGFDFLELEIVGTEITAVSFGLKEGHTQETFEYEMEWARKWKRAIWLMVCTIMAPPFSHCLPHSETLAI